MLETLRINIVRSEMHKAFLTHHMLPRSFLKPTHLRSILHEIQHHLSQDVSLPFELKKMAPYYDTIITSIKTTDFGYMATLRIPLLSRTDRFRVVKLFPIQVPIHNESMTIRYKIDNTKYLAISDDRSKYVELDQSVEKCLVKKLRICNFGQAIEFTAFSQSCALALFLKDENMINTFCNAVINQMGPFPVIQQVKTGIWIIQSAINFTITEHCGISTQYIKIKDALTVRQFNRSCKISSKYFMIPATTTGHTELEKDTVSHLRRQLQRMKAHLNLKINQEIKGIQLQSFDFKQLPPVDIPISNLVKQITHLGDIRSSNYRNKVAYSAVPTVCIILGIVLAGIIWYKRYSRAPNSNSPRDSHPLESNTETINPPVPNPRNPSGEDRPVFVA